MIIVRSKQVMYFVLLLLLFEPVQKARTNKRLEFFRRRDELTKLNLITFHLSYRSFIVSFNKKFLKNGDESNRRRV